MAGARGSLCLRSTRSYGSDFPVIDFDLSTHSRPDAREHGRPMACVRYEGGYPPGFSYVWQILGLKSFVFVSVAGKGVRGAIFVCVAGKGLRLNNAGDAYPQSVIYHIV